MIVPVYLWLYLGLLSVFLVMAVVMRRGAMIRTALAIVFNWIACSGIVLWLRQPDPWAWFSLFDTMAAIVITVRPAGRMQAAIGSIYIAMIMAHAIYGVTTLFGGVADTAFYLNTLDLLALFAVVLLGLWVGGSVGWVGLAWVADRLHFRKGDPTAMAAHYSSME